MTSDCWLLKISMDMNFNEQNKFLQSGVIPYRQQHGRLEVLLITTTSGKKWIVPKGIIEPHLNPKESAEAEALEEAGIKGEMHSESIGNFTINKWGGVVRVQTYLMRVDEVFSDWQESHIRKRIWTSVSEAEKLVKNSELEQLLKLLPELIENF